MHMNKFSIAMCCFHSSHAHAFPNVAARHQYRFIFELPGQSLSLPSVWAHH